MGPGPAESVPIGTITHRLPVGKGLPTRGDRKRPAGPKVGDPAHSPEKRRYPNLSTRKTLREHSLTTQSSAESSRLVRVLDTFPNTLPHNLTAILGEGPSSIEVPIESSQRIRKCCIFGFSAVFFPRRFTKRALSE